MIQLILLRKKVCLTFLSLACATFYSAPIADELNYVDVEFSSNFAIVDVDKEKNISDSKNKLAYRFWEKKIASYFNKYGQYFSRAQAADISKFVLELSKKYKIHPGLILSVIHVESKFNPYAVSPKGAIGLMQIMPDTGEWLAKINGVEWLGPQSLFDNKINLSFGIYYLAHLKYVFNGNLKNGLSAYNQGPAKINTNISKGLLLDLRYYYKVRNHLNLLLASVR